MKAVLTCDDVFDVLTRAPFPSGSSDDEVVESHLAVCHDCRQLAEALRPAVGLFHESMAEESDEMLPAYRGELSPATATVLTALEEAPPPNRLANTRRQPSHRQSLHFWSGFAVCLAVVLLSTFAVVVSRPAKEITDSFASTRVLPVKERDANLLAALELPSDCRTSITPNLVAADYDCCTKCHAADRTVASSRRAILKSSAACVACHDWIAEQVSLSLKFIFEREGSRPAAPRSAVASLLNTMRSESALSSYDEDRSQRSDLDSVGTRFRTFNQPVVALPQRVLALNDLRLQQDSTISVLPRGILIARRDARADETLLRQTAHDRIRRTHQAVRYS